MARFLVFISIMLVLGAEACANPVSTGTDFAVTFDGVVVTNSHVVENCSIIRARSEGELSYYYEAKVIARDPVNDLAALRLEYSVAANIRQKVKVVPRAILRAAPSLERGEQAITYGFPLQGLLARDGNLTVGHVTALRGLKADSNYIQISTPVQPGNSGGALLDSAGNVIGVVAAKLNGMKVMRATGDIPQNVNFAIELSVLKTFLAMNDIGAIEE